MKCEAGDAKRDERWDLAAAKPAKSGCRPGRRSTSPFFCAFDLLGKSVLKMPMTGHSLGKGLTQIRSPFGLYNEAKVAN
jgi:hypothetical protein